MALLKIQKGDIVKYNNLLYKVSGIHWSYGEARVFIFDGDHEIETDESELLVIKRSTEQKALRPDFYEQVDTLKQLDFKPSGHKI